MSAITDDLDALKQIATLLEPFEQKDKERIIRWACEKFGIEFQDGKSTQLDAGKEPPNSFHRHHQPVEGGSATDIKSFVAAKAPKSDNQFAAVVAFYYQFVTAPDQRKDSLTADDLKEACRLANWPRMGDPGKTIRNAAQSGLFDRAGDRGAYKLNNVGENLVAMALPEGSIQAAKTRQVRKKKTKSR